MSENGIKIPVAKTGGENWDLGYKKDQARSIKENNLAGEVAQREMAQAREAAGPAVNPQTPKVPASNAQAAVASETPKTNPLGNQPPVAPGLERSKDANKEPARPQQTNTPQQATTYAAVSAPSASNVLRQLETRQAPKVDVRQDARPDAGVKTVTAGAVDGKTKADGAQVQQFRPTQNVAQPKTATPKENLQNLVREQVQIPTKIADKASEQAVGASKSEKVASNEKPQAEKSTKKKEEDKKSSGASTPQTQTAKANRDLGSLETGVGAESGGEESQEFGHLTEIPADKIAHSIAESSSLQIFSVDASDAQGEIAALYLQKATTLRNEVIKSLGDRLNVIANENRALDLALVPLRERVANGELKTSDFLSDVNGIGIIG